MNISLFSTFARPLFFTLDAETAHGASITALKTGLVPGALGVRAGNEPCLETKMAGLVFPNPIGLAAGYDKNAEVPDACLRLGFGFVEVGTVTPREQSGNPKPRVFRLPAKQGIINRLGFNNDGHIPALKRLKARRDNGGIVGVNIGANKDSNDFVADYEAGLENFWSVATYFTANISSPNTPGLRNLQAGDALKRLLDRLLERRQQLQASSGFNRPIFLKIAPDITLSEMDEIAEVVSASSLDALIVSNTTLDRTTVAGSPNATEAGGLSGKPLFERSTIVLAHMRERLGQEAKLIGVGGVDSSATALAKIQAGANLVQLYSAMVYHGPHLSAKISRGLADYCKQNDLTNIKDLVGEKSSHWARKPL